MLTINGRERMTKSGAFHSGKKIAAVEDMLLLAFISQNTTQENYFVVQVLGRQRWELHTAFNIQTFWLALTYIDIYITS